MNYPPYEPKRLYRSNDSVIFGVCGGIAEYFDLPPFGVRLIWILFSFTGIGLPILLFSYVAMGIMLKRRPLEPPPLYANDPFRGQAAPRMSHSEMLAQVQQRFETLDRRLQRMESIVTRPGFGLEQKYRDLM